MQMQRLKEAGLNPNLMYGQGTTGNASSPQRAPVPEVQNELASLAQMSLAPIMLMYQDWRVKMRKLIIFRQMQKQQDKMQLSPH